MRCALKFIVDMPDYREDFLKQPNPFFMLIRAAEQLCSTNPAGSDKDLNFYHRAPSPFIVHRFGGRKNPNQAQKKPYRRKFLQGKELGCISNL